MYNIYVCMYVCYICKKRNVILAYNFLKVTKKKKKKLKQKQKQKFLKLKLFTTERT